MREVCEEVGIRLRALTYEGSQAWPFPGSLMLGFHAVADRVAADHGRPRGDRRGALVHP